MASRGYVPTEVINEILSKLPVKSLLRFTSVCKLWCSLINSSQFISLHLLHSDRKSLLLHDRSNYYRLLEDDKNQTLLDPHFFSVLDFPYKSLKVVGTSNGLVCLWSFSMRSIILWNPSIRKHTMLPIPTIRPKEGYLVIGFGASNNGDFKVLRIVDSYPVNYRYYPGPCPEVEVEIYSLNLGEWRRLPLKNELTRYYINYASVRRSPQALTNGAVHWLSFDESDSILVIMVFHLDREAFEKIKLPHKLVRVSRPNLSITMAGESLGLIEYNFERSSSCIWSMKEYGRMDSWTKLYSINFEMQIQKVMGFRKNGEVLVLLRSGAFFTYYPETRLTKNIGSRDDHARSLCINNYNESLILLGGQNVISDVPLLPPDNCTLYRKKHRRK